VADAASAVPPTLHLDQPFVAERGFRDPRRHCMCHGVFRRVAELEQAFRDDIDHPNANLQSFLWIKNVDDILENGTRVRRGLTKLPPA